MKGGLKLGNQHLTSFLCQLLKFQLMVTGIISAQANILETRHYVAYSCTILYCSKVLIDGLADTWPARKAWTLEQLLMDYGDVKFHLSQKSSKKILMCFKDYASYMQIQHDEDPLYVFDDKVPTR